jgi:hypothetical protein
MRREKGGRSIQMPSLPTSALRLLIAASRRSPSAAVARCGAACRV